MTIKSVCRGMTAVLIAILMLALCAASCFAADDQAEACYSVEEAGEALRSAMKDREESAGIWLISDEADVSEDLINEIFKAAIAHTGDPCEGDYLKFQYDNCAGSAKTVERRGIEGVLFTYTISYYDTAEQEEQLDEAVEEILSGLELEDKSDEEKTDLIYNYICDNVEYDYDNLTDDDYKLKHTAYAALVDGKAVCQGYSTALYRLLLEAGVDNRIIFGTGINSSGESEDHTWNIIKIGDLYYNTDVTRGDELSRGRFYLQGSGAFDEEHIRSEEYDAEAFCEKYEISEDAYGSSSWGILDGLKSFAVNIKRLFQYFMDLL